VIIASRNAPPRAADMARVPAGTLLVGCAPGDAGCGAEEQTSEAMTLEAFAIDRHEVTVADYRRCATTGACALEGLRRNQDPACNWAAPERGRHPINCVDWSEAAAFCAWAGKRLPSGAEWQQAARGAEAVRHGAGDANLLGADDGFATTAPVGSYAGGVSPYGVHDLAGNVAEWTADADGERRGVRGGDWQAAPSAAPMSMSRWVPAVQRAPTIGFRCAR
jgi:formylglycine-generating enzyme required for sulfatase activity